LLQRYAIERLLYRISQSKYNEQFVLKGAMVFLAWDNGPRRATRDLDLMGYGDNSTTQLEKIFRSICDLPVEADGLEFMAQTVRASVINEDQKYKGIRMKLRVCISGSRTRSDVQVDIGYGNPITPSALNLEFPTLLDLPKPRIKAYPPETVVAEKFEAVVKHGIENTRLKDFYDLEDISQRFAFQGETLSKAIATTFKSRERLLPQEVPIGLTPSFTTDAEKLRIWREFHKKAKISSEPKSLTQVAENIQQFLMPICLALSTGRAFNERWSPDSKIWTEEVVTQVNIEAKQAEIVEQVSQLSQQDFLRLHQNIVKYFTSDPKAAQTQTLQELWQKYNEGITTDSPIQRQIEIAEKALQDGHEAKLPDILAYDPFVQKIQREQGIPKARYQISLVITTVMKKIGVSQPDQQSPQQEQRRNQGPKL